MCERYLGFMLLAWFPQVLRAQIAAQPCAPPVLKGGYFVPEQKEYPHETTLIYACDAGRKPVAEGWWETTSCKNGKWSHEPQCVDENSCFQPTIPHGKYRETEDGWYEQNDIITVTCHKGYELKHSSSDARCVNGRWSSLPVCERRADACGEPPKIPHAVIVHQKPQEVFATDSDLLYECKDGYVAESGGTKKVTCKSGSWFGTPSCTHQARPCVIHSSQYFQYGFRLPSDLYLHEGQTQYLLTSFDCHVYAHCTNNRVMLAWCCATWDIYHRLCRWTTAE